LIFGIVYKMLENDFFVSKINNNLHNVTVLLYKLLLSNLKYKPIKLFENKIQQQYKEQIIIFENGVL